MKSKEALKQIIDYIEYKSKDYLIPTHLKLYIDVLKQDIDRLEKLEEILDILRHNTSVHQNGKGFILTIWLNSENCSMPNCSTMEELAKVVQVLKEKKVLKDTYSKEVLKNDK